MAKTKSEPTLIERIRAVHPKYAALLEKQRELLDRQDALYLDLNDSAPQTLVRTVDAAGEERVTLRAGKVSLAETARRSVLGWVAQLPKPKPQPVVRHEGAVALVGELLSPQPEHEINPPPLPPNWPEESRYGEIGRELESLAEALKLLAPELTRARREYSKLVVAERAPDYQKLVETVVDASRQLGDAVLAAHEFVDRARLDGIERRYLKPLLMTEFGDLAEQYSPLRSIIERAIELGHVGAGKRPDWKLPASHELIYSGV
ncbi:hypothetical protein [Bradyrhizobium japonicum]|uniref:hypothetical protein n=1 Tax=Bradyrhizobium japonicum TaxID=375 RepID=UPI00117D9E00|nr:hypothetical protein [Bradyrhizobium japonicum]